MSRTIGDIEESIQRESSRWIDLGQDLKAIRDCDFVEMQGIKPGDSNYVVQLIKALGHTSLERYWHERWDMTSTRVEQLITGSEIALRLAKAGKK